MSELVEQAEVHLIMSNFAAAERSSKEALDKLKGVSTPDLELQSRACSINLQALFEQGRISEGEEALQSLFGTPLKAPFSIFSLWILLKLEAGDAEGASIQLEAYIDSAKEGTEGNNLGSSEYSAACQLLLVEIWCRDLSQPSHATDWLDKDKHLKENAKEQLRNEIEEYEASANDQGTADTSPTETSSAKDGAALQNLPSSSSISAPETPQSLRAREAQPSKEGKQQRLKSDAVDKVQETLRKSSPCVNQIAPTNQHQGQAPHWDMATESSSPSLVQGLGLAAAALVVTYAAYAERHALSRGTGNAMKKIREASEKAGLIDSRLSRP